MANIKSAKKRILVNEKKAAQNQMIKSAVKTEIKKVRAAVEAGNKEEASKALSACFAQLDKAAKTRVIHSNKADRKKSRLTARVAKMAEASKEA